MDPPNRTRQIYNPSNPPRGHPFRESIALRVPSQGPRHFQRNVVPASALRRNQNENVHPLYSESYSSYTSPGQIHQNPLQHPLHISNDPRPSALPRPPSHVRHASQPTTPPSFSAGSVNYAQLGFPHQRMLNESRYVNTATPHHAAPTGLQPIIPSSIALPPPGRSFPYQVPQTRSPIGSFKSVASSTCSDDLKIRCPPDFEPFLRSRVDLYFDSISRHDIGFAKTVCLIIELELNSLADTVLFAEVLARLISRIGYQGSPLYLRKDMRRCTRACIFNKIKDYIKQTHEQTLNNYILDTTMDTTTIGRKVIFIASLIGRLFRHRVLRVKDVHDCWKALLNYPIMFAKNAAVRYMLENSNYRLCKRRYWAETLTCYGILKRINNENRMYGLPPDHPNSIHLQWAIDRVEDMKLEAELKELMRSPPQPTYAL